MRIGDSASTDKKKEKKKTAGVHVVWVKLAVPAVKEQGEGEVLKSKEEADLLLRDVRRVMEFLFFSLRLHFSVYGGTKELGSVDSSLLFSLRVLFWQRRRKGFWLAYFTSPCFSADLENAWKRPPLFTSIKDCLHINNTGTWTEDQARLAVISDEHQS